MRKRLSHLLEWLASLWMPPPLFVIRVRSGTLTASRGAVTSKFLVDCGEVLRDHGVSHCTIKGFRSGNSVFLRFSKEVPNAVRQRLRNVWHAYR